MFILFWYVLPTLLPRLLRYMLQRKVQKTFRQFYETGNYNDTQHREQKQSPKTPSKKISDDVGEYVRFEEIEVSEQTTTTVEPDGTTTTKTKTVIEEQIVDVEWEDL